MNCHVAPVDRLSDAAPRGTITVRVYQAAPTERFRIRSATEEFSVAPQGVGIHTLELLVDVVDDLDVPIANRTITLTRDGIEQSGGHVHGGQMPNGSLSTTVNTGDGGVATVVYTADVFGGKVELRGASPGAAAAVETVTVAVADLQELAASQSLGRIGVRAEHPGSHFGTAAMVTALRTVADSFHERFARQLEVNDISLPLGGKFDLNAAYGSGGKHTAHREGRSADVRTHGESPLSARQKDFVYDLWERLGGTVHDETILENGQPNTESPHYHFRF